MADTQDKYCIIGAGPAGLSGARNLQKLGIPFDCIELGKEVGGLWNINGPRSTMYNSAHLISSKTMTEYKEFPMKDSVADYPHHSEIFSYFNDFAEHFKLKDHCIFETEVVKVEPVNDDPDQGWNVTTRKFSGRGKGKETTKQYKGVLIGNGTLSEPNKPTFKGQDTFTGKIMHSAEYKDASIFDNKRVLIIGAGNSGCDIVVDAVHRAKHVDMSVRRGYHFVPKYVFGKPADAVGGKIQLPFFLKQRIDKTLLKWFTGDPERFGFPKPDHDLYESHPIVNSLVLHYLGHGDIHMRKNIDRFDGDDVVFKDGSRGTYDLVLMATGYVLHYPFIDNKWLNWRGAAPHMYLNAFHPNNDTLFILGLVEASGLGWEGRSEQAELVARYIKGINENTPQALAFRNLKKEPFPDMRGGINYLELDRMAFYVHKDTYRNTVKKHVKELMGQ